MKQELIVFTAQLLNWHKMALSVSNHYYLAKPKSVSECAQDASIDFRRVTYIRGEDRTLVLKINKYYTDSYPKEILRWQLSFDKVKGLAHKSYYYVLNYFSLNVAFQNGETLAQPGWGLFLLARGRAGASRDPSSLPGSCSRTAPPLHWVGGCASQHKTIIQQRETGNAVPRQEHNSH